MSAFLSFRTVLATSMRIVRRKNRGETTAVVIGFATYVGHLRMGALMQRRVRGAVLAPILVVLSALTAGAQSDLRKLVANRILDQYALIKTVIEPRRDFYVSEVGLKDKKYNLADCGGLAGNLGLTRLYRPCHIRPWPHRGALLHVDD